MADTPINRMGFLNLFAWMDEDGRHVWHAHLCEDEWVESMLPYPLWSAPGGRHVKPSINCSKCGTHGFAEIGTREAWEQRVAMLERLKTRMVEDADLLRRIEQGPVREEGQDHD